MIDPISSALSRIYNTIPMEILKAAFEEELHYDVSMDEVIKKEVLLDRLHEDVSQRAGKVKQIVLKMAWCEYTPPPSTVAGLAVSGTYSTFHIPADEREYSDIVCCMGVRMPYNLANCGQASYMSNCAINGNTVGQLACAALSNLTKQGMVALPTPYVLPGNVIRLQPEAISFIPWIVTCRLRYNDDYSGMDINMIQTFNQLAEIATKMKIHNRLLFKVETNLQRYGYDIGVAKDLISEWKDLGDKYDELLIALGGVSHFSYDRLRVILSKMTPSG